MKITDLKPETLWGHFAEICAIPHPSHHEEKIRAYIVAFAEKNGLEHFADEANNVIVRKAATPGMERRKGIVLQAHLDMVPQANGDKRNAAGEKFDFERDAIEPYIDGEGEKARVKARGTTLGADNGIGVAAVLAILESKELKHGTLEALFTATEETGMAGAFGLKAGELTGDILVNLDSEREGELCVGCAGGTDANIELAYKAEAAPGSGYKAVVVEVKGLKGGHSGVEINLQRANANKLIFRALLPHLASGNVLLASVDCGGLRNAIPREGRAVVFVKATYATVFMEAVAEMEAVYIKEYKGIEEDISLKVSELASGETTSAETKPTDYPTEVIPAEVAARLAEAVCIFPDGVMKMSVSMPGLVQTSSNLARVVSDGKTVKMHALLRSSVRSEKEFTGQRIAALCSLIEAKCELTGSYDGWNPDMESPILKTMAAGYEKLFGVAPEITAVHAGLECGIIGGVYPEMDMISCGPTIRYPHSPDEEVNIASVEKFWKFLTYTLETAPEK